MMNKFFYIFITFMLISSTISAQFYFRLEADISIKTKLSDGTSSLTMGKAYYDRNLKKLVYDIHFPQKEIWVIKDTLIYTIVNNQIKNKHSIIPLVQYTIFNIALEGNFASFGLKNSIYKATKVETDNELIITTWEAPEKVKKQAGNIVTSTKNKDLYGVVVFDPEGNIISKQLYKNFQSIQGIRFPEEIIQVIYKDGKESYQVISFKNVKINNLQNESFYNYRISAAQ